MTVDIYFSDHFQVDPADLEGHGAFDISLINDLPLFVDPFLLFNSDKAEYRDLHEGIIRYVRFLKEMSAKEDIDPALLDSWYRFPEVKQTWLGYSLSGNEGHGLGGKFARALNRSLQTIFRDFGEEEITLGSHLEKLCLIRGGVGRDNISDFTTNLIKGYLAQYTEAFALVHIAESSIRRVAVAKTSFNYETRSWSTSTFQLPIYQGDYVLLTPKDILTKDETWINRPELISRFREIADAQPNMNLRAQVNEYLLRTIPQGPKVTKKEVDEAVAGAIELFPQVLDYYVRDKEDHGDRASALSKLEVARVEERFVAQIRTLVSNFLEPAGFYRLAGTTHAEAMTRVQFLKDAIENKGAHRLFYHDERPIERESDLQILYRLTWLATPSDVSREVNDGRGPADFKISRGSADKTIVEFKLAKNTQLARNLAKQAEIYEKASDATQSSIKVIIFFTAEQEARVGRILGALKLTDNPNIVVIDGRADNKPSASRA
ncbi:MAG TPA: hypothetical protein VMV46_09925 [Thermoanaerobaculia bacterium]|nr:hypothetical protein [Thermoanaerobaculia bacterium]